MEKLTIQEEEVMLYIWSIGDCFVKEIVSKFPDPKPPYTTVASIVNNLKRKGYVAAQRFGNTYQYTPLIKQSEYKRTFMGGVVQNYFANSYKEMVSFFAKEQNIIRKTKCSPLFKRSDISYKTKRPPKNNFPKYSRGSKKSTGKFCFSQCFFL